MIYLTISLFLIIFIENIISLFNIKNIDIISLFFLLSIAIILQIIVHIRKKVKEKKLYFPIIFFMIISFLTQILTYSNGEIIYKIFNFTITKEGVIKSFISSLKIFNMFLISRFIDPHKIKNKYFKSYSEIIEVSIELLPEVLNISKESLHTYKEDSFKKFVKNFGHNTIDLITEVYSDIYKRAIVKIDEIEK